MREALATADHDFVVSEPASKLKRWREVLSSGRRHGFSLTTRQRRRYLGIFGGGFFAVAAAAILVNALAWQTARHPAPLFSRAVPPAPSRGPRIVDMSAVSTSRSPAVPQAGLVHDKALEKPAAQKSSADPSQTETPTAAHSRPSHLNASPARPLDSISQLLKAPPAPKAPAMPHPRLGKQDTQPAPSKTVLQAQLALVKLGFILKPDGVAGATTRRAIKLYERDHGLAVHGDLTPALVRRLSTEAGISPR